FLPLEEKCNKAIKIEDIKERNDLLTGWLECRAITKSAVFIPNPTNEKIFTFPKHGIKKDSDYRGSDFSSYDFYSYEDLTNSNKDPEPPEPVLPGSELRGVIRKSFEALTNSCIPTQNDVSLYKRTTQVGDPGILFQKNGVWYIQPCERWGAPFEDIYHKGKKIEKIKNLDTFEEGQRVYAQKANRPYKRYINYITDISSTKKKSYQEGFIHFGDHLGDKKKDKRHFESVFFIKQNEDPIKIEKDAIRLFLENVKLYRKKTVNILLDKDVHKGYPHMAKNKEELMAILNTENRKLLVYFTQHTYYDEKKEIALKKCYLNPGMIGREIYHRSLEDILKSYNACSSNQNLCCACSLFGFINSKNNNEALGSRVRFTDAALLKEKENLYFEKGIISELASPKLSCTEFYLKRPKNEKGRRAHLWNYDYAGYWDRYDFKDFESYDPEICGRKFYWHQKLVREKDLPYIEKDGEANRKVGIRPLKPEVTFSFKVYFNNITESELKRLIWIIEQGNKDNTNAHKIGMGKPLGLGSIKFTVENIKVRRLSIKNDNIDYQISQENQYLTSVRDKENVNDILGCNSKTLENYLKITNMEHGLDTIEYPNNLKSEEHYEWFMYNREIDLGSAFEWRINQTLCNKIDNPELKKYHKGKKRKSYGEEKTGTVKWFNRRKNYGFIAIDDENQDIFVHISKIQESGYETLNQGEKVKFKVGRGRKGPEAQDIEKI
ncbi:MAG: TIGR03986 family CRISPR-associated RAMP protein, partial [Promethearchaeia archaeon]